MPEPLSEIDIDIDTERIREWQSIVTLIVFVFTSKYNSYIRNIALSLSNWPLILYRYCCSLPFPYSASNSSGSMEWHVERSRCLASDTSTA